MRVFAAYILRYGEQCTSAPNYVHMRMLHCASEAVLKHVAGAATALLMVTIAPQSTFPVSACKGDDCYNNAAAWCIFSAMEPTYLHRLIGGCRVLLANVIGQVAMLLVAQLVNNLDPYDGYPQRWL